MPIRDPRYPEDSRYGIHSRELHKLLGLPQKLPTWGAEWEVQGYRIKLLPLVGEAPRSRWGGRVRRMKHRMVVECKMCACWVSVGRLPQHERGCKQKDNYTGSL